MHQMLPLWGNKHSQQVDRQSEAALATLEISLLNHFPQIAADQEQSYRQEYISGYVYAMTDPSKPCKVVGKSFKVRVLMHA